MKRIWGFICVTTIFLNTTAQIIANDSATTSSENKDMTFYSLQTGQKAVVANNDWHLALSVRPSVFPSNTLQGASLRINEAYGMHVYVIPGFTADSFNAPIDTAGFHIWERVYDSDSILDEGAFNTGYNIGTFYYGWGFYTGAPQHSVVGNKVYLLQLTNRIVKKMWIESLDRDTAWNIKVADLDNSNPQSIHIGKRDYPGKNYVYVNLQNYNVYDKEPLSADWDLQFLKYAALDVDPFNPSPIVGVWTNKGRTVAKRKGVNASSNDYSGLTFSPSMNRIGWNWKYAVSNVQYLSGKNFTFRDGYFSMEDSLAYFVQSLSGDVYKIVFTGYGGYSTGVTRFYKEKLTNTAISETEIQSSISIFPNPANGALNVVLNSSSVTLKVFDISGREISEHTTSDNIFQLSTAEFANGVYLLAVTDAKGNKSSTRFIVSH